MSNGIMKNVNGTFRGEVRTMRLCFSYHLEPILGQRADKAPNFKVIARSPMGHDCQVGVCWEHTINKGEKVGQSMFSLSLTDPDFGDEPVSLSAFPTSDGYALTVERKRGQVSPVGDAETKVAA